MIYVITCDETKSCKIGYSKNPEKRLKHLQTGNPSKLHLTKVIPGEFEDEKQLHSKFKHLSKKGEWFELSNEIEEYFKFKSVNNDYLNITSSFLEIIKMSNDVKLKMFASLVEKYGDDKEFSMTKALKEVIANETGCKARSLDTAFTDLVRKNVIVKIGTQLYKVNPRHVFKGSTTSRNEALKAIIELGCREC